jgi:hypothetical protein
MKLSRITKPLRSVQVRVTLAGDLNTSLEDYARYYEHIHGEPVDSRVLMPEILRAFLDADRESQSWSRSGVSDQPGRISTPPTSNGSPRHRHDWPQPAIGGRASHVFTTGTCLQLARVYN